MIITCRLCGEILKGSLIHAGNGANGPAAVPIIDGAPQMDRAAMDYQAAAIALVQHVAKHHADYAAVLSNTAQTYYFHLVAKLGMSTDPEFEPQRESARALVYWTLAGKFGIEDKGPVLPPNPAPTR